MRVENLENMVGGWFIGNFTPSVFKNSNFEVALKRYKKGQIEKKHLHKIANEYTLIVEGEVLINNVKFYRNDIIHFKPGELSEFEAIEDSITLVVKCPSVSNDKYVI